MSAREEFLTDIVVAAVEGGTGYWAAVSTYDPDKGTATLHEWDDDTGDYSGPPLKINLDIIRKGIGIVTRDDRACRSDIRRWIIEGSRDNDATEIDADAADVIVQLGLFGELVYG